MLHHHSLWIVSFETGWDECGGTLSYALSYYSVAGRPLCRRALSLRSLKRRRAFPNPTSTSDITSYIWTLHLNITFASHITLHLNITSDNIWTLHLNITFASHITLHQTLHLNITFEHYICLAHDITFDGGAAQAPPRVMLTLPPRRDITQHYTTFRHYICLAHYTTSDITLHYIRGEVNSALLEHLIMPYPIRF